LVGNHLQKNLDILKWIWIWLWAWALNRLICIPLTTNMLLDTKHEFDIKAKTARALHSLTGAKTLTLSIMSFDAFFVWSSGEHFLYLLFCGIM